MQFHPLMAFKTILFFALSTSLSAAASDPAKRVFVEKDINACIESVCGPAKENIAATDVLQSRQTTPRFLEFWRHTAPAVDRLIHQEDAQRLRELAVLRSTLADRKNLELKHPGQLYFAYIQAVREIGAAAIHIADQSADAPLSLSEAKFARVFGHLPESKQKLYRLIAQNRILPSMSASVISQLTGGFESLQERLDRKQPSVVAKKALSLDAKFLLQESSKIENAVGPLPSIDVVLLEKAQRDGRLTNEAGDRYVRQAVNIELFAYAFDDQVLPLLQSIPFDVAQAESLLKSYVTATAERAGSTSSQGKISAVHGLCQEKLSLADTLQVSSRLPEARKNVEAVKRASLRVLQRMLYAPLFEQMKLEVEGTSFQMPEDGSLQSTAFGDLLQLRRISLQKKEAEMKTAPVRTLYRALLEALTGQSTGFSAAEAKADRFVSFCQSISVNPLKDFSLTSARKISVGWFTVLNPETGIGTLAHEMGHVVARRLSVVPTRYGTYQASKACVKTRNPFYDLKKPTDESIWTEEDWADHFATLVISDLRANEKLPRAKNFICPLVLDQGDTYTGNRMQPAQGAWHSSAILRLLVTSQDLGEVTEACAPFLAKVEALGHPLACQQPEFK